MKNRSQLEIIGIFIGFYSLLFTILFAFYPEIFKNPTDLIVSPFSQWKLHSNMDAKIGLNEFFEKTTSDSKENDKVFIFILDVSGSVSNKKTKIEKPYWYDASVKKLKEDNWPNIGNIGGNDDKVDIFSVAQIRLCQMLAELHERKENKTHFAIWTVGDIGTRIYPSRKESEPLLYGKNFASIDFVSPAIRKISEIKNKISKTKGNRQDTDFSNLLKKIVRDYKLSEDKKTNFIITVLSDLVHDVEKKILDQYKRQEIWNILEDKIKDLSDANIMANMIILTSDGELKKDKNQPEYRQIFPIFKKEKNRKGNLYTLSKNAISDKLDSKLLFSIEKSDKNIHFYYENRYKIKNHVDILSEEDSHNIFITIPSKFNNKKQMDVTFQWILSDTNERKKDYLSTGESLSGYSKDFFDEDGGYLKFNNSKTLKLKYVHNQDSFTHNNIWIRIFHKEKGKASLINIQFERILPLWLAILMCALYISTLIVILHKLNILKGLWWLLIGLLSRIDTRILPFVSKKIMVKDVTKQNSSLERIESENSSLERIESEGNKKIIASWLKEGGGEKIQFLEGEIVEIHKEGVIEKGTYKSLQDGKEISNEYFEILNENSSKPKEQMIKICIEGSLCLIISYKNASIYHQIPE